MSPARDVACWDGNVYLVSILLLSNVSCKGRCVLRWECSTNPLPYFYFLISYSLFKKIILLHPRLKPWATMKISVNKDFKKSKTFPYMREWWIHIRNATFTPRSRGRLFYISRATNSRIILPRRRRVFRVCAEIVDTAHCSPLTRERGWGWGLVSQQCLLQGTLRVEKGMLIQHLVSSI